MDAPITRPALLRHYVVPAAPRPGFQWLLSAFESHAVLKNPPAFASTASEKGDGPSFTIGSADGASVNAMHRTALAEALGPLLGIEPSTVLSEVVCAIGESGCPSFLKTWLRVVTVANETGSTQGIDDSWYRRAAADQVGTPISAGAESADTQSDANAAPDDANSNSAAVQIDILQAAGVPVPAALSAAAVAEAAILSAADAEAVVSLSDLLAQAAAMRTAGSAVPTGLAAAIVSAASAAARADGVYADWDPLGRDADTADALRDLWARDLKTADDLATAAAATEPIVRRWEPTAVAGLLVTVARLQLDADLIRIDHDALPDMARTGRVAVHRAYCARPNRPSRSASPPRSVAPARPRTSPARTMQRALPDPAVALAQQRQLQEHRDRERQLLARVQQLERLQTAPAVATPVAAPPPPGTAIERDGFSTMSTFLARNVLEPTVALKIKSREFVPLHACLFGLSSKSKTVSLSAAGGLEFDADADEATETAKSSSLSMRQAREALNIWATAYARLHAEEAAGVRAYVDTVFPQLEKLYGHAPAGIYEYDRQFRRGAAAMAALAADMPLRDRPMPRWHVVDAELERSTFCNTYRATCHCGSGTHYTHEHERVTKSSGPASGKARKTPPAPGAARTDTCHRYNSAAGKPACPDGADCKYAHACSQCGGDHPARRCPRTRL